MRFYFIKHQNKILSLLDQGFVSFLNFGSIFILSKLASKNVFGDFVVAYSYSVFLFLFTSLFISSPVLIFFSKKWMNHGKSYLKISILLNVIIAFFVSQILFYFLKKQVGGFEYQHFFLLCIGTVMYDLIKKFCYSIKRGLIKYGFLSSFILNLIFFGLILMKRERLSVALIFDIYGYSFLLITILLTVIVYNHDFLKTAKINSFKRNLSFFRLILKENYHYAKWLILGGIFFWVYTQGIYILANHFNFSVSTIGKFRLIQSMTGVFAILTITIENYYKPIFSTQKNLDKFLADSYRKNIKKIILLFLVAFPIGLGFYQFIYAEKYGNGELIFTIMIMAQLFLVLTKPISVALKAKEFTRIIFIGHAFAALTMLLSFIILSNYFQNYILVFSYFLANLVFCGSVLYCYLKTKKMK